MSDEWVNEMSIDEIPDGLREVAKVIGSKAAIDLAKYFGGQYYYFPKIDKALSLQRDKKIRKEFNGSNHRELARKYDLSENWIRRIVGEHPSDSASAEQPLLFQDSN